MIELKDTQGRLLGLVGFALSGATALKEKFPEVEFTSGTRSLYAQAHAMATNIVESKNLKWIEETYRATEETIACQKYVDANDRLFTGKQSESDLHWLADAFMGILQHFSLAQLMEWNHHLAGLAFDVKPMPDRQDIIDYIQTLPGLDKFLERESNLIRWHCQFKPSGSPDSAIRAGGEA